MCSRARILKLGVLGMPLALYAGLAGAIGKTDDIARGERLFTGREPLQARIGGDPANLPVSFARCANCHDSRAPSRSRSPREARLEARLAPPLDRGSLTQMISRRGGPPFAYDASSFCHTLRTGIDPRYVILARAMPRFDVDQTQCDALWAYLAGDKRQRERNEDSRGK